jgi:hypothetical protein
MIHVDGGNNDWVTTHAAGPIAESLTDLIACLERASGSNGHQDHDGDRDDDDDNDDNHHH